MRFRDTRLAGVWEVLLERHEDERGSFARSFCRNEFTDRGLVGEFVQASRSVTRRAGTVRGMHFQRPPFAEVKLVRCVRGAVFDVVADLRPHSPSFMRWQGFELRADGDRSLYIPEGCAHGFQALTDDTEVLYGMSTPFEPGAGSGFRHDDAAMGIAWPLPAILLSPADLAWPPLAPANPDGFPRPFLARSQAGEPAG